MISGLKSLDSNSSETANSAMMATTTSTGTARPVVPAIVVSPRNARPIPVNAEGEPLPQLDPEQVDQPDGMAEPGRRRRTRILRKSSTAFRCHHNAHHATATANRKPETSAYVLG